MTVPADLPWARLYPDAVDWSAPLTAKPLPAILDEAAQRWTDRPLLDFFGRSTSYAEVRRRADRMAVGLQRLGLKPGERVGLMLPNCPAYVILYFAVLKAGGIVVNFNPLYAEQEVRRQAMDAGLRFMVTIDQPSILKRVQAVRAEAGIEKIIVAPIVDQLPWALALAFRLLKRRDRMPVPRDAAHMHWRDLEATDGTIQPSAVDPVETVAVLQYTGGTTGVPKGAMLTHANLTINAWQSRLIFPRAGAGAEPERMLALLPFFHVFGMTAVMNLTIMMGGTLILIPRFDLKQLIKTIHTRRPTLFPAVPTIYTAINHFKGLARYDLSSIRFCISGGAPLPLEVKRDFERLTGCVLVEGYGLSETSPVAVCNPAEGENRAGSIGLPLPGTYVDIVSLEDGATCLPLGEKGEVCIRGPQVMKGYWNHPEETAGVLKNTPDGPRLHTGDIGFMDPDGYVFIVDRIKDMIMAGGFKIYPRLVEEAIYQHPAVAECIVAGVADAYRGQTVKAWIALKDGQSLTQDDLVTFLKDKLSPIEMPKHIEVRDHLPRTTIGKLSKKLLLEEESAKG